MGTFGFFKQRSTLSFSSPQHYRSYCSFLGYIISLFCAMAVSVFEIDLPPLKRRFARFVNSTDSLKDVLAEFMPASIVTNDWLTVSKAGRVEDIANGVVLPGAVYHVMGKLVGGKGGFGSLLRAIGMQIERTKNKEACRDLSGRRMRDINNEKKLKEWFSKAADRMVEKEHRKRERREKLLREPKVIFDDQEYMQQREQVIEEMEAALQAGMERAKKRAQLQDKSGNDGGPSKKMKSIDSWAGVDISTLSSSSSEESDSDSSSDLELPPPDLEFSDDENETSEGKRSIQEPGTSSNDKTGSDNKPSDTDAKKTEPPAPEPTYDPIDLDSVSSIEELSKFGLGHLKAELLRRNMKCGGTLQERVKRLWEVKCPPPPPPAKELPKKPEKTKKSSKAK